MSCRTVRNRVRGEKRGSSALLTYIHMYEGRWVATLVLGSSWGAQVARAPGCVP